MAKRSTVAPDAEEGGGGRPARARLIYITHPSSATESPLVSCFLGTPSVWDRCPWELGLVPLGGTRQMEIDRLRN